MTKKLNTGAITNELEGSVFFSQKKPLSSSPVTPKPPANKSPEAVKPAVKQHTITQAPANTPSEKRTFIKRAFDIFGDQLSYLTKESLQDRLAGKEGSMNAMLREALDEWIKKRKT